MVGCGLVRQKAPPKPTPKGCPSVPGGPIVSEHKPGDVVAVPSTVSGVQPKGSPDVLVVPAHNSLHGRGILVPTDCLAPWPVPSPERIAALEALREAVVAAQVCSKCRTIEHGVPRALASLEDPSLQA
jgi:hypothetical protein